MKKTFLQFLALILCSFCGLNAINAQSTTITTAYTSGGQTSLSSTNCGICFGLNNSNPTAMLLTGVAYQMPASTTRTWSLWYKATPLTGPPGAITVANGWTMIAGPQQITSGIAGITPIFTNLTFNLPATTAYRLALVSDANSINYYNASSLPDIFTGAGVSIWTVGNANSPSYAGNYMTGLTTNPRGFWGSVTVEPAAPCTNPPTAGASVANPGYFCGSSANINLSLNGNSVGVGQTYEWESSPTGAVYTSMMTPSLISTFTTVATAATWYRCKIQCSGGVIVYSTPIQVTTMSGLPGGTYTINDALPTVGTNFNSFTDAVNTMMTCGILGPIVINVNATSGPYNERLVIGNIPGSSAINTVRINGNGRSLEFAPTGTTDMHLLNLNGTRYVTIDSLVFKTTNAAFGWGAWITGNSQYDTISRCDFDLTMVTTSTTANCNGIVIGGTATSPTTSALGGTNIYTYRNKVRGVANNVFGISYAMCISPGNNIDNSIIENKFEDFYLYGIYLAANANNTKIIGNEIHRANKTGTSTFYGIYSTGTKPGTEIRNNRIHTPGGVNGATGATYGIYLTSTSGTMALPIVVANNAIYNLNQGGAIYGMYLSGVTYGRIYHNTIDLGVNTNGTSVDYGAYLLTNSNAEFKNNIITITGAGTGIKYGAFYSSATSTATNQIQRNNIYVNSSQPGVQYYCYYAGVDFSSLSAFQTSYPALEVGSVSQFPYYQNVGAGNLKPLSGFLYQKGTNVLATVPNDILGVTRTTTPTPGAWEIDALPNNDAAVMEKVEPTLICATTAPVKVSIANMGGNIINNLQVHWTVNGTPQTAYNYTTPLNPAYTSTPKYMDTITLANFTFTPGVLYNFKVWTTLPNNTVDPVNGNDTIEFSLGSSLLAGTYTINGAIATGGTNFQTVSAFTSRVNQFGICGPIVVNMNAANGPYTDQMVFGNITGSSAVNTITINGNGSVVQHNASTLNPHLLVMNGSKYIKVDSVTFKSTSIYGWGAILTGGAENDSIVNCTFDLTTTTNSSNSYSNGITLCGSLASPTGTGPGGRKCYIGNNKVLGSTTAAGSYYYGITLVTGSDSNVVENNLFANFHHTGFYISSNPSNHILYNEFHRAEKPSTGVGNGGYIINSSPGTRIIGNKIHSLGGLTGTSTSTYYGIQILSGHGTAASPSVIANNLLYNFNQNGLIYGISTSSTQHVRFYHNTIDISVPLATTSATYGFYASGSQTGTEYKNNIVTITGGTTGAKYGYYFTVTGGAAIANLQRNNVYVNSTQAGTQYHSYYAANYATLAALQAAHSGIESGSLSVDPLYTNIAVNDYTPSLASGLYEGGLNTTALVPLDINKKVRAILPTPGAFEMDPPYPNNAGCIAIMDNEICYGISNVRAVIRNAGTATLDSVRVYWSVNGTPQTMYQYTGALAPSTNDTIIVGSYNFTGTSTVKVWTSMPNGVPDPLNTNDTSEVSVVPRMGGAYTINSAVATGGTNYQSFAAFTADLALKGVCAPIVATVAPGSGPYTERVEFGAYSGVSAINTITIKGNNQIVQYNSTSTAEMPILIMNGAKYVNVDSVVFRSLNANFGWGALFTGLSEYDSVTNCTFDMTSLTTTSSTNGSGVVFSASQTSPTTSGLIAKNCYLGSNVIKGSTSVNGGMYYAFTLMTGADSSVIENNEIGDYYVMGMYLGGGAGNKILGNTMHRANKTAVTTFYGIYGIGSKPGTIIDGNKIHSPGGLVANATATSYGLYFTGAQSTAAAPLIVSNNIMYKINALPAYGIYSSSATYVRYYNNTINFDLPVANANACYGAFFTGTHTASEFKNNIISYYGGGTGTKYGYYFSTTNAIPIADVQRNNIYMGSTQSGLQYHSYNNATNYNNLAALQAANAGIESGSLELNPQYVNASVGNLKPTIGAFNLYANGLNLGGQVPRDIVGVLRPTLPTPGAFQMDEPMNNNAATVEITSPTAYCAGSHNVTVTIGNQGLNTIDSVRVNWSVNGVSQPTYYHTTAMYSPTTTSTPTTASVTIGSYNFANGITDIKVWTSHPNGATDPINTNDTIETPLQSGYEGVYTINPALPQAGINFTSISNFISALEQKGVCGPVVANVASGSGPYNERVYVGNIPGTSNVNTVRINGNGNTVQWNSTTAESQLLRLTGTKYLTIDNLVFKSMNVSYGWGAMIWGGAEYDSITNCTFDLTTTTGTSTTYCNGITFNGSLTSPTTAMASGIASNCYIGNNQVLGPVTNNGYYYAMTIMQGANNITVEGNTFANFYVYGIYMGANLANIKINKNTIHRADKVATTTFYGIYSTGAKPGYLEVTNNRIHSPGGVNGSTGTSYGIYFSSPNVPATDTFIIANNALYNLNQGGSCYGIYVTTGGANTQVLHNTIDFPTTLTSTVYGMYFSGTHANGHIKNNMISLPPTGSNTFYGYYHGTTNGFPQANVQRNNIWRGSAAPPAFFYHSYHGGNWLTLANLQASYPAMEVGSLSIDPQYVNAAAGNLSPQNAPLHTNGLTLNNLVSEDIIGIPRPNNPTVGAFEKPISNGRDGWMVNLINPGDAFCPGLEDVSVDIMNYGNQQLTNFNIHWTLNGVPQPTYAYTGVLDTFGGAGQFRDTVVIGVGNFPSGVHVVKAWLAIANDVDLSNDTIEVTVNSTQYSIVADADTICKDGEAKLSIDPPATFANNTRQWFSSTDGINYTAIANSDVSSLTLTVDTHTYFFVEFSLGSKLCYSDTIMITVMDPTVQPFASNILQCGPGAAQITAQVNAGIDVNWYDDLNATTPLFTGNSFTTPFLTTTTTFWAEGFYDTGIGGSGGEDSVQALPLPFTTNTCCINYHMFLIENFSTNDVTIDKFWVRCTDAVNTNTSWDVYYRPDNYQLIPGANTNAAGWTLLFNATNIPSAGTNDYTLLEDNVGLLIPAGQTYSIHVAPVSGTLGYGTPAISTIVASSPELNLRAGNRGGGVFSCATSGGMATIKVNYSMGAPCVSDRVPVTVTVHPVPEVDLGPDIVKCVDPGHLEFLNAANFGSDYLWDNNYNGMVRVVPASGTYWVQVTNQYGCIGSDTINVTFKPNPLVDLGNDTTVCNGVTLGLDAGNDGIQYYWNTGQTTQNINVNNPGTYFVQVTGENGCVKIDSITINMQGQLPTSGGILVNNLGPYTFSFSCVNPLNIIGYQWSFGDGNYSSQPNPVHTYSSVGNYVVTLNLSSICGFAADSISTHIYTKIDENQFDVSNLTLYPNPATERVTIKTTEGLQMENVRVLSVLGAEIYKHKANAAHEHSIDLSGLASGMYSIEVSTDKGMITRKLEVVK